MAIVENHLIEMLPVAERRRLLNVCEPVQLVPQDVLCEPGEPIRHVYFPSSGVISLLAPIDGSPSLVVRMVGREGMLGVQLVMGVPSTPFHALVQGPGAAWRIGAKAFRIELERSAPLQRILNRYLYVLMSQLATAAGCQRFHPIGARLARFLLMSHDRAHTDCFRVTHEYLANMLGVRRVGVTAAAGALQRGGLIAYRRGEVSVRDRGGLEAAACSCYAADRRAYAELLP